MKQNILIALRVNQIQDLDVIARQKDVARNAVIRWAIDEYIAGHLSSSQLEYIVDQSEKSSSIPTITAN